MGNQVNSLTSYFRKMRNIRWCISFSALALIAILFYFYATWNNQMVLKTTAFNSSIIISLCVLYAIGIVSWIFMKNRFVSIYMMFYIYLFFSNLGQSLIHLFTNDKFSLFSIYARSSLVSINQALLFQFVCLAAFNLGTAIATYFYTRKYGIRDAQTPDDVSMTHYQVVQYDRILDVLMIISTIAEFSLAIAEFRLRQTMTYEEIYEAREAQAAWLRFASIVLGIFYGCRAGAQKDRIREFIIYALWILFIVIYMLTGTRSRAIVYLASLLFMLRMFHPKLFRKRYIPVYIAAILGFIVLMSIITVMRQTIFGQGDLQKVFARGIFYNFKQAIFEFGISEYPAIITIKAIDRGLTHYQTIFYYMVRGFVPMPLLDALGFHEPEIGDVALWATSYSRFKSGETGFSMIAEAYMNYGKQGWIFTGIYGGLITYWEILCIRKIKDGKLLFATIFIYFLSRQVFFARGNFRLIVTAIRYAFYVWILYMFLSNRNKNTTPKGRIKGE